MLRSCVSDYKIPKAVIVRSFKFCPIMIDKASYQIIDDSIISSVKFRVKGINNKPIQQNQRLLIDDADYTVPSLEKDSLFIITNSIQTDQEYTRCSEPFVEKKAACVNNSHCQLFQDFRYGNGKWTGRCLAATGRCEMKGWCPVMNDHDVPTPSQDTLYFTILIENFIENTYFNLTKSNMYQDASYLRNCEYDPASHPRCPTFRIGTLLDIVEYDRAERRFMLKYGGVIHINIDWICNLDRPLNHCIPKYSFRRLGARSIHDSVLPGFNFRFASHWKRHNESFRTLTKAYGLRFVVSVNGYFSRFDIRVLIICIIFFIGTICLITFIFDIIGLHIYRRSAVDQSQISENVVEESKRKNEVEL